LTDSPFRFRDLKIVLGWLTPQRRVQLGFFLGLSLLGALAELATLAAVMPFLAVLDSPDRVLAVPLIGEVLTKLDWTSPGRMTSVLTLLFGFIVLVAMAIRLALTSATANFSQKIGHDISVRVFDRMLHQSYSYHISRNTSEIIASVEKSNNVVVGVLWPVLDVFVAAVTALAILGGLLLADTGAALLAGLMFGFVYLMIGRFARGELKRNSQIVSTGATARIQVMQEGLGGIRDVLLDRSQHVHLGRFQVVDEASRTALAQNTMWGHAPRHVVEALGVGIIAGLAAVIAHERGGFSNAMPVLGALVLGAQKLLPLFQRIFYGWTSIVGASGFLADISLLANAPMVEGARTRGIPALLPFNRMLRLNDVGFRYRPDAPWIIRKLDIAIPKGARVGFIGETGCGKSTLLDLIMGLLQPTEGWIEVDGMPLNHQNQQHWQARIAHVPQSIFLADASLQANIAFGEPPDQVDFNRIKNAAVRARIHDVIQSMEDGYDTKVGERGVRLSGGQRQRVGIARALYRRADVLILDEATSALDGDTEASVMEGIAELGPEITVLIVAHRISTLNGCDFVVRLTRGGQEEPLADALASQASAENTIMETS
jgi:ABC-type multidrug transport system fused ATPase/permease subunit